MHFQRFPYCPIFQSLVQSVAEMLKRSSNSSREMKSSELCWMRQCLAFWISGEKMYRLQPISLVWKWDNSWNIIIFPALSAYSFPAMALKINGTPLALWFPGNRLPVGQKSNVFCWFLALTKRIAAPYDENFRLEVELSRLRSAAGGSCCFTLA